MARSFINCSNKIDCAKLKKKKKLGANIPESEDGGSLLGSSRKSLADTSVTSTADLSVFSGGQRSQQAFDICVDDNRSLSEDDAENQSSSGWVMNLTMKLLILI